MFNIGRLDGTWNLNSVDLVELTDPEMADYRLDLGDILLNRVNSRELVGKCAVVDEQTRGAVFESKNIRVRVDAAQVVPEWAAAWLNSVGGRLQIDSRLKQIVGQATVNRSDLNSLALPLPPLAEQRRIAGVLREQMGAVARARAALEAQLAAAEALPAAYLRDVFQSPQAQSWPRRRLGDLLKLRKDVVHPRDKPSGAATFVGLEHIERDTGRRIGNLKLEQSELTGRKPQFQKGDIVYGYLRPYLNKVWKAEFDGLCSVDQYVYAVKPDADTDFIVSYMRSPVYLERAPIDATPGQLPRIRTEEVASVEINLPSLPEQRAIAARLATDLAAFTRLRLTLTDQLAAVERLPAALLRRAFAGEI